jgi:hypothetical protein
MRRRSWLRGREAVLAVVGLLLPLPAAPAADTDEHKTAPGTVVKTAGELHFVLPPDWPVEERGGLTAPVPVEEYLAMKFSGLEGRLRAMDQQLQALEVRLRVLEESAKAQQQGLRSGEGSR